MVMTEPVIPIEWGLNSENMQSHEVATPGVAMMAQAVWLQAAEAAAKHADRLVQLGIHKQIANRLLEPFVWVTVMATAVEFGWQNFFALRAEEHADPHMQRVAYLALEAYNASTPQVLQDGEWHIPFGNQMPESLTWEEKIKVAVARAARVSYNNFDGTQDTEKDFKLHDRLAKDGHWSSFEHIAQIPEDRTIKAVVDDEGRISFDIAEFKRVVCIDSNLVGWHQLRKDYPNECRTDSRVIDKTNREKMWYE